jgi:hypothetical protein
MLPALRDFQERFPHWNPETGSSLDELVDFLTCHGVKVGGVYQHFKGGLYEVTGICRDSEYWSGELLVQYVECSNTEHRAVRKVSNFLGDVHVGEYNGPRFRLMR